MNKYYFTFGIGQPLERYFQLIVAENMGQAREKMFEEWGRTWAFSYSEKEFADAMKEGHFKHLKPLKPIYAVEMMTVGEMRAWTERLNQILGASQVNKARRLKQFKKDIAGAYGSSSSLEKPDWFAACLYAAADMYMEEVF